MRFISFFAGYGGLDLGLERAGHKCIAQSEINPHALDVLHRHWPDGLSLGDITLITEQDLPDADMYVAGFPCQNISSAGKKEGIHGPKSGLFFDFARLVRAKRPRLILLENVSMLTSGNGGLLEVLGELAESGYNAEWETLPCGIFGAPHQRHRTFVVGYADCDCDCEPNRSQHDETSWMPPVVANSEHAWRALRGPLGRAWGSGQSVPWDRNGKCTDSALAVLLDDGISNRMERLRGYGNSASPIVAEYIGRLLMEASDE